jgi:hypothetical protein
MIEQLEDAFKAMNATSEMMGTYEKRKLGRTEIGGVTVSTAYTTDMGYETAILDKSGVYPVERYATKELAAEGHENWCKKIPNLTEIRELGYGSLADEKTVKITR